MVPNVDNDQIEAIDFSHYAEGAEDSRNGADCADPSEYLDHLDLENAGELCRSASQSQLGQPNAPTEQPASTRWRAVRLLRPIRSVHQRSMSYCLLFNFLV